MVEAEALRPIKNLVFLPHEAGMPSSAPLTRQEVIEMESVGSSVGFNELTS